MDTFGMISFLSLRVMGITALLAGICLPAEAHPVPFSYVDVRVFGNAVDVTVVAHVFDVAHDLSVDPPERLLEPAMLSTRAEQISALIKSRLKLEADGAGLTATPWSAPEALLERQSIRLHARYPLKSSPGSVTLTTAMFPYDQQHQTFVNFYENDAVTSQSILDKDHTRVEYFAGGRQGVWTVLRRFISEGVHHILSGPDHLLFLVGLLLLGGTTRQLVLVVTAFTAAHSVTLSLAALNIFSPPSGLIEPAIALTVVYAGADNLLVRGGRDMRAWIAFAFGIIHGFGFANVLREMDLPSRALGWTLFGFNVGVEIGQLCIVVLVASLLAWIKSQSETVGRRVVFAGSILVMAAGAFWFVQRVFFPGGIV